jgi:hypothetical protein
MEASARPHLFGVLAGLFLAAGMVTAAGLATSAWLRIAERQLVSVTGSARRAVRADLVLWRGVFSVEAPTLLEAQLKLKADRAKVETFMRARTGDAFSISPISIQELRASRPDQSDQRTVGYRLTQSVEWRSGDADAVARLERDTTSLVEEGVAFMPAATEFIYTRAAETKVEMVGEAAKDARARAEQIAAQGGRKVGRMREARLGVFQISPLHSTRTSWEGMNDTTSLDKTVTAVVNATFSIE